ncbi:dolichyl-diphosphooligosaccharide--protein glycosyltransferase subunit 1 [Malassezia nana]|uniref:Dolichyl-diphosphooligosaccharide--protein glycosyltransferase subunit 1 n=1 Tax=Malassezia nana TaxID=180528 RepID=A0AAF0EIZ3_9BASI|nr:dolichyl-diphosphooligosaccharide--protein glycosyltransferase subunit 1 [Malassezia nana]
MTLETSNYDLYFSKEENEHMSSLEAFLSLHRDDVNTRPLGVLYMGLVDDNTVRYQVSIPPDFVVGKEKVELKIQGAVVHPSEPLPRSIEQGERQLLLWKGDVMPRTPYSTTKASVVVHTTDTIVNVSAPVEMAQALNRIAFGPFKDLAYQKNGAVAQGTVHYLYTKPVITYVEYERKVQISHWGDNLATEDHIWVRNDGPKLKGHFNRAKNMLNLYSSPLSERMSQIHAIPLLLPYGSQDVYYVDAVGNVSTSHLAASPIVPGATRRLEITPRFPILGGWNYSFTVGWNQRMSTNGLARVDPLKPWRTRVAVPFLLSPKSVAINEATLRIVLPEGAKDIDITLPFGVDSLSEEVFPTYLDTIGRPTFVLKRAKCTFREGKVVYVEYTLPWMAHMRKVFAVSVAALTIYFVSALIRKQSRL